MGADSCEVVQTTGSTGKPVKVLRHAESYRIRYLAQTLLGTHWHKPDLSRLIINFSVREKDAKRNSWGVPEALFYKTGPSITYQCIERDLASMYLKIKETLPGYTVSNSSIALALAKYSLKHDANNAPRINAMFSSSEAVTEELRALCFDAFGAKVIDRYSCVEVGWIAMQCPIHNHLHLLTNNVIMEIVDETGRACDPGVPGRVLITALHSHAMPLIRYEVGDMAQWGGPCDCGIKLPVIDKIWGKEREFIKTPNGELRHMALVGPAILELGEILDIRIRYYSNPLVVIEIVSGTPFGNLQERLLEKKIWSMLGFQCPIRIEKKLSINWGNTDKRILFMDMKKAWIN